MKMTTEEAFVKTLQMHGIRHAFGIIGSAMMPISDIFPKAGIMFWDCAHEGSAGMMADGYTRATGEMSMMIAQNGPGITNFVTAVKTAYWNHTPLLLVTPQAANKTIGQGGFQEVEQMKLFEDMVAYQEEVRDPSGSLRCSAVLLCKRTAPLLQRRSISRAICGPRLSTLNCQKLLTLSVLKVVKVQLQRAAELMSNAKFPVILNGAGVVLADAFDDVAALAERLDAPVCVGYQHNDAFPGSHPLFAGPLGYNGSKAGMELICEEQTSSLLWAHGLNPFSTLPGYGIDYWPTRRKDHPS